MVSHSCIHQVEKLLCSIHFQGIDLVLSNRTIRQAKCEKDWYDNSEFQINYKDSGREGAVVLENHKRLDTKKPRQMSRLSYRID